MSNSGRPALRAHLVVGSLVTGVVLLSLWIGVRPYLRDQELLNSTGEHGQILVDSLIAFHAATGRYPGSLSELGAAFVSEHAPAWGTREWLYEASETGFRLSVTRRLRARPELYFATSEGRWILED